MLGDHPTGAWSEEITAPYCILKVDFLTYRILAQSSFLEQEAGFQVTIASVLGGEVPIDKDSLTEKFLTDADRQFYQDEATASLLKSTPALNEVSIEKFDCIFLAGGHGTCIDFPDALGGIVSAFWASGKVNFFFPVCAVPSHHQS